MEYLKFDNGLEISSVDLAAMVRAEGKLGTKVHIDDDGLRCVLGVALNVQEGDKMTSSAPLYTGNALVKFNDNFGGTPEERAEAVAQYVEGEEWAWE